MNETKSGVYLMVDKDGWTKGLQLSIDSDGLGYRFRGPKCNGSSSNLMKHELNERDLDELRDYIRIARRNIRKCKKAGEDGPKT